MNDQDDCKNGHDRVPDKRPEIGPDDVENLIDFDNSDEEDNVEVDAEDSEELSEMQVVNEAAQLLEQDDSDEIQEIPGAMPSVLYEFDPINEVAGASSSEEVLEIFGSSSHVLHEFGPGNEIAGPSSIEELQENLGDMPEVLHEFDPGNEVAGSSSENNDAQEAVEQQIMDLTGVLIEMVEERSDNRLHAEEQLELAHGDTVKEASPRKSVSDERLNASQVVESEGNSDDLNGKSCGPCSTEDDINEESSEHHTNNQHANSEPFVHGGNVQIRNSTSGCPQSSNVSDEDQSRVLSALCHGQFDGVVNTRQPRISLDMLETELNLQGESSESNHNTQNERCNEAGQSGESVGESLNAVDNLSIQSAAQLDVETSTELEKDYSLRNHVEDTSQPLEQKVEIEHLNGRPGSGPDPDEQQEKVGHLAANGEAVAQPEAALEPDENNPDQIDNIVPDEQDNLLEEQVEEVQVAAVPEPLETEQGANEEEVIVVEDHVDAEAQMIQTLK